MALLIFVVSTNTNTNLFLHLIVPHFLHLECRSRWLRCLRRRSAAVRLLESRVRIALRARMFVSCVCCVLRRQRLSRRAGHLFRGVLPCACVCVCVCVSINMCDIEISKRGGLGPTWAAAPHKNINVKQWPSGTGYLLFVINKFTRGTRSFPGAKRPESGVQHPPQSTPPLCIHSLFQLHFPLINQLLLLLLLLLLLTLSSSSSSSSRATIAQSV